MKYIEENSKKFNKNQIMLNPSQINIEDKINR